MQLLKHVANDMQRAEGFVLERALVVPASDIASGESLSELPTLTFHCDKVEGRSEEERKRTYTTLYAESVNMLRKFQKLISSLK